MTTGTAHPLTNFDEPLRVLQATHLRIELRLALLAELCRHVQERGSDASARTTAGVVLRYFDESESCHQADEEADLFPALAAAADAEGRESLGRLLARLAVQHGDIQRSYQLLRPHLVDLANGADSQLPAALCARLHSLYMEHIAIEEEELIPLAKRNLSSETLRRIGSAMAARRAPALSCS